MTATINGNKFVKTPHLFIEAEQGAEHRGCYYPTMAKAVECGTNGNGVGLWTKEIRYAEKTWYQAGNVNVFD